MLVVYMPGVENVTYSMKRAKIAYLSSRYQSHSRIADIHRDILRRHYTLVCDLADADIVILHCEPCELESVFRATHKLAGKYIIGYCVWEATKLPSTYRQLISHFREIWTCSRYCQHIFASDHSLVSYIPHPVMRDISCSETDRNNVRDMIGFDPSCVYYLTVTKVWDKRKNTAQLIRAFERTKHVMPKARLIVKASASDVKIQSRDVRVIPLYAQLTGSELNALYELTDACVSAHHSEGWGLTLSDAMIFGKAVIATGYSGNLEFMSPHNSTLVRCTEQYIDKKDCFGLFESDMKWAYPDEDDLENQLFTFYGNGSSQEFADKIRMATWDIRAFSYSNVSRLVNDRIASIVKGHSSLVSQ